MVPKLYTSLTKKRFEQGICPRREFPALALSANNWRIRCIVPDITKPVVGNVTPATQPMRKSRLLLVDDSMDNLQVVGGLLKCDTMDILTATSGQETLRIARAEQPDLILLDVMMPGMDGYETCRQLKRHPATAGIPVIFLTARTETEDIVAGFDAGGVDYVSKPFRIAELRARVHTHIELHRLRGLLSVCSYCNRIRDTSGAWTKMENYVVTHSSARFTHGVCPDCVQKLAKDFGLKESDLLGS